MGKHRILIIDDESDTLAIIRDTILTSDENYILYQALNGKVALRIAKKELPDLIITDWEMPGMDGIELIKALKNDAQTSEIPVIMSTGVMTSSENLYTALQAGAVDYIRKPIDRIELTARIKSMLKLADSKKELQQKYRLVARKNNFISTLIESLPQPMVFYRKDGIIEGYNFLFQELMVSQGININTYQTSVYSCFPGSKEHEQKDRELFNLSKNILYEVQLDEKFYVFSKNIYINPDSGFDGVLCILTDITPIKEAHKYILETKKREITSYAMRLLNFSKMKDSLVGNLKGILDLSENEKNAQITQIMGSLNIDSKQIWNEFETQFSTVFEDFYTNLDKIYPDLSAKERKLCAFLKLNFSTKEIATLTFQNPKSIDMARYRLRKKMQLDTGDNILDILKSI